MRFARSAIPSFSVDSVVLALPCFSVLNQVSAERMNPSQESTALPHHPHRRQIVRHRQFASHRGMDIV
jgi:hypothetical protein